MPLTAQITLSVLAHEASSGDLSRTLRVTPANYALGITDGTGANQAQVAWSASRSGSATTTTDFDLSALADTRDGAAVSVAFTAVKFLYIRNASATNPLWVGTNAAIPVGSFATNHWAGTPISRGATTTGALVVLQGGIVAISMPTDSGVAVSGTSKILRITGIVDHAYDIVLVGEGTVT
ncbi:MAG: hypothetical protein EBR82_15090 [Caulobacteraceae bacterium]|nr:hypothetical protein [Caulobacteraceae bacterium]